MLGFTEVDLKQTRFYQDVHGEGREEEAVILMLRLLNGRFGKLNNNLVEKIQALGVFGVGSVGRGIFRFCDGC